MISFRKISAASNGKLIRAYLSEGTALDDPGRRLATYYAGRDPRVSWRPDMAPGVARALGIDPTLAPGNDALERLFEAKQADTGEAWTSNKRTVSAYDLTASPDKSVTLAIEFARDDAEKAALTQAVWRANDDAMRFVAGEIGWAQRGRGGRDGIEPGDVGWASFMHFTARPTLAVQDGPDGQTHVCDVPVPGDPQTHIHNAMFNLVVTADGHIGSLDSAEMHDRVHEFGAYFQARLADELRALGIEVAYNKTEQAAVIACIPEFAREAFSKGHKATVRKAKGYAQRHGLDWDALPAERKLALLGTTAQQARNYRRELKLWPGYDELRRGGLQGGSHGLGVACNGLEVGAGRLIRFHPALFPVAQGAEGDLIAGREFLLGQPQGAAQGLSARYRLHFRQPFRREGLGVGIGKRGGVNLGLRHGRQRTRWRHRHFGAVRHHAVQRAVTVHSDDSIRFAHIFPLAGPR